MEPLIVVFQYTANGVKVAEWAWLKKKKDAIPVARSKRPEGSALQAVWTCAWRSAPSHYELAYGYVTEENQRGPFKDIAASIRDKHLRKPKDNKWTRAAKKILADAIAPASTQLVIPREPPKEAPKPKPKAKLWNPYYIYEAQKRAAH